MCIQFTKMRKTKSVSVCKGKYSLVTISIVNQVKDNYFLSKIIYIIRNKKIEIKVVEYLNRMNEFLQTNCYSYGACKKVE